MTPDNNVQYNFTKDSLFIIQKHTFLLEPSTLVLEDKIGK